MSNRYKERNGWTFVTTVWDKYKMDFMTLPYKIERIQERIQDMPKDQLINWALNIKTVKDPLERQMFTEMYLNDLQRRWNREQTGDIFEEEEPAHIIRFKKYNPP
jgi:hypothetical protein